MKITVLNFEAAEVDTLMVPPELPDIHEAMEGFLIGRGYDLGAIEWMCHE